MDKMSESKIDLKTAEKTTLEFISKHIKKGEGIAYSVWKMLNFIQIYANTINTCTTEFRYN